MSVLLAALTSIVLFLPDTAQSEDLGVYGQVYEIAEQDAIETMKAAVAAKLANGGQEALLKGAKDRYFASLENIKTPEGITSVRKSVTRLVDLSQTQKDDIKDDNGNMVVPAGTRINPLAVRPLTKKLFFIDAKDERQLALVKKEAAPRDVVILLGGSIFKANDYLQRRVYLDVPGLHTRMQIRGVPSIASQQGDKLKVQEIAL